jgi:hypothetical protein
LTKSNAITLVALLALGAAGASPATASADAPAWRLIFETSQTIYYVGAANVGPTGETDIETLQEFKVPQVFGGDQIWSVVSRYELNCGEDRIVTLDNSYYPRRMGAGAAIQALNANDAWHTPEPGSLGELVWNTACRK